MGEVSTINTMLGRYVLRFFDADAGRTEPLSITDERLLAERAARLVDGLRARADRRERDGDPPPLTHHTRDTEQSH